MRAKVKVPETIKTVTEREVEFPIYRRVEGKKLFVRIDLLVSGNMRECAVQFKKNGQIVLKINNEYVFEDAPLEYLLGTGDYVSDADEFTVALKKVQNTIAFVVEDVK